MTAPSFPHYAREDLFDWSQRTTASWRLLPQAQIQRIDYAIRHEMSQFQTQDGETTLAQTRIEHLTTIAQHRWSKAMIGLVELFVLLVGMLAFNALPTQFAKLLGRQEWSQGIGLLVGAIFAWLIHNRAVRGLGKLRRRHDSRQALKTLIQDPQKVSDQSEFFHYFYKGQQSCLRQVEGDNLQGQFWLDLLLAIVVSFMEGIAIFYQIQQSTLTLLPVQVVLISVLPVALIWLAALLQSDRDDFVSSCADLIADYRDFLPQGTISEAQALHLRELDAVFKHFTAAIPSGIRTVKGARAQARSEFAQVRIEQLEAEGIQAIEQRKETLRQTQQQLPNQFPMPPTFDVAGYRGFEIPSDQHTAWQNNTERIAQETLRLRAEAEEDYALIQARIRHQIERWKRIKAEAEQTQLRAEQT